MDLQSKAIFDIVYCARKIFPSQMTFFQKKCWLQLPFPLDYLYADPERKAYDLLGLYFGIGRTFFNPASASVFSRFDSLKEAVKNYTIEATPDDRASVLQQGGMFVFRGKELIYARKDEGTGDHAPLDDVLNICCKAPAAWYCVINVPWEFSQPGSDRVPKLYAEKHLLILEGWLLQG